MVKIDGFEKLFMENGKGKVFIKDNTKIVFKLYLYNKEKFSSGKYREYWIRSVEELFQNVADTLNSEW